MSALTAFRRLVLSKSAVTALVGDRVHVLQAPQKSAMPALALHLVTESDGRHLLGTNRYPVAQIVVDCIAKTFAYAELLGNTLNWAVIDYRGSVTGYQIDDVGPADISFFDKGEKGELVRWRIGFLMRYRVVEDDPDESPPEP